MQDRRNSPRQIVNSVAKIGCQLAGTRDCIVADISDGGVRILAEDVDVPEEFVLFLESANGIGRKCRVVWRLENEIGAEFVEG